jgi:hydrogenase maturation protein HypF
MNAFPMCDDCKAEYEDPTNRRFHAQPNACFLCGPQLYLSNNKEEIIFDARTRMEKSNEKVIENRRETTKKIIARTIGFLKEGNIIAIKGLGGFHLAVDASNEQAVKKLRERKHRYEKPLALMSYNFEKIKKYACITTDDEYMLDSVQKPITLLKKNGEKDLIAPSVAPNSDTFGVMLPYTPFYEMLLEKDFTALVMTSGNISDEPIYISNEEAVEKLSNIVDYFLLHNRDIYFRCDDSVVKNVVIDKSEITTKNNKYENAKVHSDSYTKRIYIRRSRGYVPAPIFISKDLPHVLALGAELKNNIAFTKNKQVFLSQHIGDLENMETLEYFITTIDHLKNILQIEPEAIAHDLHPEYLNSRWLSEHYENLDIEHIGVQHHHAHIVSCMAENFIDQKVIGLAMDGTGLGADASIWGGEVLISELSSFERYSHFSYMPLPGGDLAIREPWRIAVSYLYKTFPEDFFKLDIPLLNTIEENKKRAIVGMIDRKINSPLTSSLGRLFDAVSSLLLIREYVSYEGQAATELETIAYNTNKTELEVYNITMDDNNLINTGSIIKAIVNDIQNGISSNIISRKFHLSLVNLFTKISLQIRNERNINIVALSGGCFQNSFLLEHLVKQLKENSFEVITHRLVPCNDGGISLGQAVIAGSQLLNNVSGSVYV